MAGPSVVVRVLGDLKGLGTALDGTASKAEGVASRASKAFGGFLSGVNATGVLGPLGDALAGLDQAIQTVADHAKGIGTALLGAGAAVTGVGALLSAAGSKDQAAHQQLAQAIDQTGGSIDDYGDQIDKAIGRQENFGHTAAETQDALTSLVQATHDPREAIQLLGIASDIAASKHEDLGTAAGQLGKVYNGNTKLLKQFGIVVDSNTKLTTDGKTAIEKLAEVVQGQASASTDTFTGKLDALKAKFEDFIAMLGQKWGPAIQTAGIAMMGFGAIIDVVGLPIFALALAILALIAVIAILYAKWDEFWSWAAGLPWYAKIGLAILAISNPVTVLILTVAGLAVYWNDIWSAITTVVGAAKDTISGTVQAIAGVVVSMVTAVGIALGYVVGFVDTFLVKPFQTAWDIISGIVDKITGAIDTIKSAFDNLPGPVKAGISAAGSVAGFVGSIPGLQHGGIVTRPTLALVGEAGPEAVVPLDRMGRQGPVVHIQNANFAGEADIDLLLRRTAWATRTAGV